MYSHGELLTVRELLLMSTMKSGGWNVNAGKTVVITGVQHTNTKLPPKFGPHSAP